MYVAGNYKIEVFDEELQQFLAQTPDMGMEVEVTDPDDEVILSRVVTIFVCHYP